MAKCYIAVELEDWTYEDLVRDLSNNWPGVTGVKPVVIDELDNDTFADVQVLT
jgi:hypothetical protein